MVSDLVHARFTRDLYRKSHLQIKQHRPSITTIATLFLFFNIRRTTYIYVPPCPCPSLHVATAAAVPSSVAPPFPAAAWHSAHLGLLTEYKRIKMGDHCPGNASSSSKPSPSRPRVRTPPSSADSDSSPKPPPRYAIRHVPQSSILITDGTRLNPSQRARRPRRKADQVERLYRCTWEGCEKSYGTL